MVFRLAMPVLPLSLIHISLAQRVHVPIVASGGAGGMEDFAELFTHPGIDAGLAASIFHTRQVDIRELKQFLRARGVEMRR